MTLTTLLRTTTLATLFVAAACGAKKPAAGPASAPNPFPTPGGVAAPGESRPPAPPAGGLVSVPAEPPISATRLDDPFAGKTPDDINNPEISPLKPVFFEYDSDMLSDAGRKILDENAQVLKKYSQWVITIEGHCDERGTSEYNLALGDRRALAVKNYLQSLGIAAARLGTVSYGKEFPFDPGHTEGSWKENRRAHLMVTATR